jgi:hypothetical protein
MGEHTQDSGQLTKVRSMLSDLEARDKRRQLRRGARTEC